MYCHYENVLSLTSVPSPLFKPSFHLFSFIFPPLPLLISLLFCVIFSISLSSLSGSAFHHQHKCESISWLQCCQFPPPLCTIVGMRREKGPLVPRRSRGGSVSLWTSRYDEKADIERQRGEGDNRRGAGNTDFLLFSIMFFQSYRLGRCSSESSRPMTTSTHKAGINFLIS